MRGRARTRDPTLRASIGLVLLGLCAIGTAGTQTGCGTRQKPNPLPDGTRVTVRGHREVTLRDGQAIPQVVPRFLGGRDVGLCFEVAEDVDSSQWQATLSLRAEPLPNGSPIGSLEPQQPAQPVARLGSVLCFERSWPTELDSAADLEICARLTDLYDGTDFEAPCQPIRLEPDTGRRSALMREVGTAVAERHRGSFDEFLERLGTLARSGRDEGFPAFATRADLIAVHYLLQEGAVTDIPRAERLLASLPEWIHDPAATALEADAVFLAGVLNLLRHEELEGAWQDFLEAHTLYSRILDRKRLAAVRGQVEVLARVGLIRESLLRLDRALAECDRAPCSPTEQAGALGLESWLTLLDTEASRSELASAVKNLEALLEEAPLEPAERANHLVNLALLQARQGQPPTAVLARTDGLFQDAGDSRRADVLSHWAHMAEALYELSRPEGGLGRALQRCRRLAAEETTPQLTAWAFSCMGRILHRQGRLVAAQEAFRRALSFHGNATPERLGRLLPLGPSHRADDYYRAARLALDLGDGDQAWSLLEQLDREGGSASGQGSGQGSGQASGQGSDGIDLAAIDDGYRAFSLDDEILLLHHDGREGVREVRRTVLPRGDLRERTDAIDRALEEQSLSDEAWRELVRPLTEALRPEDADLSREGPPSVLTYALHGMLQKIPLAALPVSAVSREDPGAEDAAPRWLANLSILALRPATAAVDAIPPMARDSAPVVILDPSENLGSRTVLASFYAERFPASRRLLGRDATVRAFTELLPSASWLHADIHGFYDPAFPERSSLELADGVVTLRELADLPLSLVFANLSGCRTGTWPVSADSGRYGIGGLLARRGAQWVIASRSDLLNRLALEFNPVFYRALGSGSSVPQAYEEALESVRRDFPAVAWASIFLLRGTGETFSPDDSLPLEDETPAPAGDDTSQPHASPWR